MSMGRARNAVHTNAFVSFVSLSQTLTLTKSPYAVEMDVIAPVDSFRPQLSDVDLLSIRLYKCNPCQCSNHGPIPGERNLIVMFMQSPACPPSTPSVCSLALVPIRAMLPGFVPKPSWFRGAHVCGFFGTWGRYP